MSQYALLEKMLYHQLLDVQEAELLMQDIIAENVNEHQLASVLTILSYRSEALEEVIGFRNVLLKNSKQVQIPFDKFIDIVGTGGDGKNTFNISTLACFVVAGAGYKVVKHGNYSASSLRGSSDILEYFGYRFSSQQEKIIKEVEKYNITFLHAPLFHPSLKPLAPIRKNLPFRTIFNLLGPLLNPSNPPYTCLGVADLKTLRLYKDFILKENKNYSVIHSFDGYDEISLTHDFIFSYQGKDRNFSPTDIFFQNIDSAKLYGGDSKEQAMNTFSNILNYDAEDSAKNVVISNAAFAIYTMEEEKISIKDCMDKATESLKSGNASKIFNDLMKANQR